MCPAWLRGNCIDPSCSLRHSAVQVDIQIKQKPMHLKVIFFLASSG
jgi:hypothetical protein